MARQYCGLAPQRALQENDPRTKSCLMEAGAPSPINGNPPPSVLTAIRRPPSAANREGRWL